MEHKRNCYNVFYNQVYYENTEQPWGNLGAKPPELEHLVSGKLVSYKRADIYSLACIVCGVIDANIDCRKPAQLSLPPPFSSLTPLIRRLLSDASVRPSPTEAIAMLLSV